MRVLWVTTFPPRRCGIGDYSADIASIIGKLDGVHLRILTYSDAGEGRFDPQDGFELVRELGRKPVMQRVASEISRFQPDLVHLQSSSFLHPPAVNRSIARACPSPLVTTVHDTPRSWRVFYTIPGLRRLYLKSARLIVHSPSVSRVLAEFHHVDETKIVTIPHGVDVEKYSPNAPGEKARTRYGLENKRFVLFFGFLRPGKGVETLLEAWRELEKTVPDALLVVAGGTPSRARRYFFMLRSEANYPAGLAELAKSLGIERRVRFTGYVPEDLVPGLLASAETIVLPYHGPFAQSGPLHKALGSGRPLIASKVPGSEELLEDGRTALLTPAGDSKSLAKAIYRVLTDAQLADRLGRDARRMAEESLGWKIVARKMLALYESVLTGT